MILGIKESAETCQIIHSAEYEEILTSTLFTIDCCCQKAVLEIIQNEQ
jgi:hypothetical protein